MSEGPGAGAEAAAGVAHVVDARGLRCPLPIIRLAEVSRGLPAGTLVAVRWTDPAARYDVPAWARMRGHAVLATEPEVLAGPGIEQADDGAGPTDAAWVTTVRLA